MPNLKLGPIPPARCPTGFRRRGQFFALSDAGVMVRANSAGGDEALINDGDGSIRDAVCSCTGVTLRPSSGE